MAEPQPSAQQDLVLVAASAAQAPLLANLLELYVHDLSDVFNLEVGADGRFGYKKLPLYFSEPDKRLPFLIYFRGQVAGFALVTRGSPVSTDPNVLDMAEFFVLRRHRREGVGGRAAALLWDRYPAPWIVRVSAGNRAGLAFWQRTVSDYATGGFELSERPGSPHAWHVFHFQSANGKAR